MGVELRAGGKHFKAGVEPHERLSPKYCQIPFQKYIIYYNILKNIFWCHIFINLTSIYLTLSILVQTYA